MARLVLRLLLIPCLLCPPGCDARPIGLPGNDNPDANGPGPATCGNRVVEAPETCDDGNEIDDDGCAACQMTDVPIDTEPEWNQASPAVAVAPTGEFILVWSSEGRDGSEWGIFARRYDRFGEPAGAEFQVNTLTEGSQAAPGVAVAPDGRFVIVWSGKGTEIGGSVYGRPGYFFLGAPVVFSQVQPRPR